MKRKFMLTAIIGAFGVAMLAGCGPGEIEDEAAKPGKGQQDARPSLQGGSGSGESPVDTTPKRAPLAPGVKPTSRPEDG